MALLFSGSARLNRGADQQLPIAILSPIIEILFDAGACGGLIAAARQPLLEQSIPGGAKVTICHPAAMDGIQRGRDLLDLSLTVPFDFGWDTHGYIGSELMEWRGFGVILVEGQPVTALQVAGFSPAEQPIEAVWHGLGIGAGHPDIGNPLWRPWQYLYIHY